jgi:hypothetical protein
MIHSTVFSSIKRTFGEHVTARKFPYMVKEIFLKAALLTAAWDIPPFNTRDLEGHA